MGTEILSIPEEYLEDVTEVIRTGLSVTGHNVHPEVKEQLTKWCDDNDEYLNGEEEKEDV